MGHGYCNCAMIVLFSLLPQSEETNVRETNAHRPNRGALESPPRHIHVGQHPAECDARSAWGKLQGAGGTCSSLVSQNNASRQTHLQYHETLSWPQAPSDSLDFHLKSVYDHSKDFFLTKNQMLFQAKTLSEDHRWVLDLAVQLHGGISGVCSNVLSYHFSSKFAGNGKTWIRTCRKRNKRKTPECGSTQWGAPFTALSEAWLKFSKNKILKFIITSLYRT